jgi:TRAP-type mannitol/chloroaromatic compound transport system permease small subunit
MAGTSSILQDGSILSKLDRLLFRVEGWFALLSGLAVFSLMILAVRNVGGRHFFNVPLSGYVDWIEQVMPLIAFMGISYTQRMGGHIRMDIVVGNLKGRALWLAEIVTVLLMLILMLLLVWSTYAHFLRSFDMAMPNWSLDSSMDINLPVWPAKLMVPIAFFVLCLRLVLQLISYVQAFVLNLDAPIGVPLVQSAAEQAAAEAEHVSGLGG